MPRQVILSALEREALLASPANRDELIRWYTFSEADLALIRQRRGEANRLSFAVQLCLLRYMSPFGWEHINLTGDYVWRQNRMLLTG